MSTSFRRLSLLFSRSTPAEDAAALAQLIERQLQAGAPAAALDLIRLPLVTRVARRAARGFEAGPLALFIVDLRDGLAEVTRSAAKLLRERDTPGAAQAAHRLERLSRTITGDTFVQHLINTCLDALGIYTESTPVPSVDPRAVVPPLVALLGRVPSWTAEWSDPRGARLEEAPDRPLRPAEV